MTIATEEGLQDLTNVFRKVQDGRVRVLSEAIDDAISLRCPKMLFALLHNYKGRDREKVLYKAAARLIMTNQAEALDQLIRKYNLDIERNPENPEDRSGTWTFLLLAARHNQLQATRVLLDLNADVNARDKDGNTALHLAARHGYSAVAQALASQGADPRVKNHRGYRALDMTGSDVLKCVMDEAYYPHTEDGRKWKKLDKDFARKIEKYFDGPGM